MCTSAQLVCEGRENGSRVVVSEKRKIKAHVLFLFSEEFLQTRLQDDLTPL